MNIRLSASVLMVAFLGAACGNNDKPYEPAPAWTGRKPSLPTPPEPDNRPLKSGDAYTVYGASHQLRSRIHEKDVNGKEITIEGYIVQSNIEDAPACAVHPLGKADPEGCKSDVPSFYIADAKGDPGDNPKIRVLGWAKNFATVYDAMKAYKNGQPKEPVQDDMFAVEVPYPLPAVGAKVRVTGTYGFTFTKLTTGMVSDPKFGVLTYKSITVVEQAPEPASFKAAKI